jgi:hypothetical protein
VQTSFLRLSSPARPVAEFPLLAGGGLTSWWRGPRHGNGNGHDGRWNCSHLFRLGPGCRGGGTTNGHYQHVTISMFSNSTKQQTNTWKIRLLPPSACAPPDDPAVPKAELRSTPRLAWRSCSFPPLLQLPSPPGGFRSPWIRCWAKAQLLEPSSLRQRRWGVGGLAEGCRAMAGSCGTIPCVPAEDSQLVVA